MGGFYNNLLPGGLILADRGFNISDDLVLHRASLALPLPTFTKGRKQLSQNEVEVNRSLSKCEFMLNEL